MLLNRIGGDIRIDIPPSTCIQCRGAKLLCGKPVCPIVLRAQSLLKAKTKIDNERIEGSSPPSFFVGRIGYPKLLAGPLVPPEKGDTSLYATPEKWRNLTFEDIVDFRSILIRGKKKLDVKAARNPPSYLLKLHDAALSIKPVESEMVLKRPPTIYLSFSEEAPPFGPSAPLVNLKVRPLRAERKIEKLYYDDLSAKDSILILYNSRIPISKISEVLSLGMLGTKRNRKLVPTRWSITAVDSAISEELVNELKGHPPLNEVLVYVFEKMGNKYVTILIPGKWSFEWIESWFPGTTWNPKGYVPEVMGDYEGYKGRSEYPDIGGCYYASRLAVSELLCKMRRQAKALLIREIYHDYLLPLGVWVVRESLREAYEKEPIKFDDLKEALKFVSSKLKVPFGRYLKASRIVKEEIKQRKLIDFTDFR